MPTPVIVIAAIVAFFAFLFFMRVKVCVSYKDDIEVAFRYLFITYRMKQQQKGQAKQEKQGQKAQKEQAQKEAPKKKLSYQQLRQFLELFERFQDDAKKFLQKFQKKVRIDSINIELTIGSDDAATTAITYGEACAIIFPAVSALELLVKIKRKRVIITPDFNGDINIVFEGCASMRLGSILALGITSTLKVLIALLKNPIHIEQRGVAK